MENGEIEEAAVDTRVYSKDVLIRASPTTIDKKTTRFSAKALTRQAKKEPLTLSRIW